MNLNGRSTKGLRLNISWSKQTMAPLDSVTNWVLVLEASPKLWACCKSGPRWALKPTYVKRSWISRVTAPLLEVTQFFTLLTLCLMDIIGLAEEKKYIFFLNKWLMLLSILLCCDFLVYLLMWYVMNDLI